MSTEATILRALALTAVLDVEHTPEQLHAAFRAVRHELLTLRDLHVPRVAEEQELASAHVGRATRPDTLRHKILEALATTPMADFQVRDLLAQPRPDDPEWPRLGAVRRRRHELMAARWLEPDPNGVDGLPVTVRQEATGRDCTVYRATTAGYRALGRLRSGQAVLFTDAELTR